jgi:hypothetical protein
VAPGTTVAARGVESEAPVKRSFLILSVFAGLSLATVACSDDTSTLKPEPRKETDETEDDDPPAKKKDTTPSQAVATPPPAPPPTTTSPVTTTANSSCGSKATALECGQCCIQQNNPISDCACGAGSKCQGACGGNLCAGKMPDIGCGLCLLQAQCEIDFGGGGGNDFQQEIMTCLEQSGCQSKGGALPQIPGFPGQN